MSGNNIFIYFPFSDGRTAEFSTPGTGDLWTGTALAYCHTVFTDKKD
jgi:hypothetical protein